MTDISYDRDACCPVTVGEGIRFILPCTLIRMISFPCFYGQLDLKVLQMYISLVNISMLGFLCMFVTYHFNGTKW